MKTRITIVVFLMVTALYWLVYFVDGGSHYDTMIMTAKVILYTLSAMVFCLILNWILTTDYFNKK